MFYLFGARPNLEFNFMHDLRIDVSNPPHAPENSSGRVFMMTARRINDFIHWIFTWTTLILMLAILIAIASTNPPAPAHLLPVPR